MSTKKIIAVVGATGAQGGGLVNAILADTSGEFAVRAITRNAGSDKAKALAAKGVEVVVADNDNEESLANALAGAYGAYFVTSFWEHFTPEKEKTQALNMAKAAKTAGVKHVIWSSLEDTRELLPIDNDAMPTLMDVYNVPHFDAKGEANKYFAENGVPTTVLNTSFYWDNMIHFGSGPTRGEDGKLALTLPMEDKKLPGIAVSDIGKCALGIFKDPSYIGKTVSIAGEHLTGTEMANALASALGEPVAYNAIPASVFRTFPMPGADDMGNMFQFKTMFEKEFVGARDINVVKSLNPELQSFASWLESHKLLIPIA